MSDEDDWRKKCGAILEYLREKFPNAEIEQRNDFDLGAEAYKLHVGDGTRLLKVGRHFIVDYSVAEILKKLEMMDIQGILTKERDLGVIVTSNGVETFDRG